MGNKSSPSTPLYETGAPECMLLERPSLILLSGGQEKCSSFLLVSPVSFRGGVEIICSSASLLEAKDVMLKELSTSSEISI